MHGLDIFDDEDAGSTVFRDVIMLALVGFVAMVILMLPYIHPPGAKASDQIAPPGNVIVEIRWPDQIDADVDLWVQAPGEVPVGYSNKGGRVFNLLRDDPRQPQRRDRAQLRELVLARHHRRRIHGQPAPLSRFRARLSGPGDRRHERQPRPAAASRPWANDTLWWDMKAIRLANFGQP